MLELLEVRWTCTGKITLGDMTFVKSGGDKHECAVGLLLDREFTSNLTGCWLSQTDFLFMVKIRGQPFNSIYLSLVI